MHFGVPPGRLKVEEGEAPAEGPEASSQEELVKRTLYPPDHERYKGLAAAKGYDQSYSRIAKVRYSHEAMIDMIIEDPSIRQNNLAEIFGVTVAWVSRIIGSDAFQGALAKRREDITDPFLFATIEERLKGLAMHSIDVISKRLEDSQNVDVALKAMDTAVKALGFGARDRGHVTQNNFVVQMPEKSLSSEAWALEHKGQMIEHQSFQTTAQNNPLVQPKKMQLRREGAS
jgi:hypothetical protein